MQSYNICIEMNKYCFLFFCVIPLVINCKTLLARPSLHSNDDYYLNGGFAPGKRCVNMWDEGCINGQLTGSGNDDHYLNGGFAPGKRCVNMWDEGCVNGQLTGSGNDDYYLNGSFGPGKRSLQALMAKVQKSHP